MSKSVVFAQRRYFANRGSVDWEPRCAPYRIPLITGFTSTQTMPGGWDSASFVIPKRYVRFDPLAFPSDTTCFVREGMELIFYGVVVDIVPQDNGDYVVNLDGMWHVLAYTYMREIWADNDFTKLQQVQGGQRTANTNTNSNGNLEITMTKGSSYQQGDYIAMDYLAFDEATDLRDGKLMDGWEITIGGNSDFDGNANLEFRIYGMQNPSDSTPNLLQSWGSNSINGKSVTRHETSDTTNGQNTTPWQNSAGYRMFRLGLWCTGSTTLTSQDRKAILTEFKVATRARTLNLKDSISVQELVKDVWHQANQTIDIHPLANEENGNTTGISVVSPDVQSSITADDLAFVTWTTPQDIVTAMVEIDGSRCGMWGPNQAPAKGSFQALGGQTIDNVWYRQPAKLSYGPWSDISDHDYVIRLGRGATWEPAADPLSLATMVYTTYTNLHGTSVSDVEEDTTAENRLWEQGKHRSVNYEISPATSLTTAQSLGRQYLKLKRQPSLIGTLTLYGDAMEAIELPGGGRMTRLSAFKCGVVRVVDANGAKVGRVEQAVYTSKAPGVRETLVLTLNAPAASKLDVRINRLTNRDAHRRSK